MTISHKKLLTVSLVHTASYFCVDQCWTSIKSLFFRPDINQLLGGGGGEELCQKELLIAAAAVSDAAEDLSDLQSKHKTYNLQPPAWKQTN